MNDFERDKLYEIIIDIRNQRLKVLNPPIQEKELQKLAIKLPHLAKENNCSKITIYSKKQQLIFWTNLNFRNEGQIDGFFNGQNALLCCFYPEENQRKHSQHLLEEDKIVKLALEKRSKPEPIVKITNTDEPVKPIDSIIVEKKNLEDGFYIRKASESDVLQMAQVFKIIFGEIYPTNITDNEYLKNAMKENLFLVVVKKEDLTEKIVSIASSDVYPSRKCVELGDCATLIEYQNKKFMTTLLIELEKQLQKLGYLFFFSLTRANSPGMNISIARLGYEYNGRLINNCIIGTGLEDMNIWVKSFSNTFD